MGENRPFGPRMLALLFCALVGLARGGALPGALGRVAFNPAFGTDLERTNRRSPDFMSRMWAQTTRMNGEYRANRPPLFLDAQQTPGYNQQRIMVPSGRYQLEVFVVTPTCKTPKYDRGYDGKFVVFVPGSAGSVQEYGIVPATFFLARGATFIGVRW